MYPKMQKFPKYLKTYEQFYKFMMTYLSSQKGHIATYTTDYGNNSDYRELTLLLDADNRVWFKSFEKEDSKDVEKIYELNLPEFYMYLLKNIDYFKTDDSRKRVYLPFIAEDFFREFFISKLKLKTIS